MGNPLDSSAFKCLATVASAAMVDKVPLNVTVAGVKDCAETFESVIDWVKETAISGYRELSEDSLPSVVGAGLQSRWFSSHSPYPTIPGGNLLQELGNVLEDVNSAFKDVGWTLVRGALLVGTGAAAYAPQSQPAPQENSERDSLLTKVLEGMGGPALWLAKELF